jgi:serine/threonine-protein kinase
VKGAERGARQRRKGNDFEDTGIETVKEGVVAQEQQKRKVSLIGSAIGNYDVVSQLGAGAMGEVYLGEHPDIGRKVAIKVLVATLSANAEMAERFVSEARAVNKINHPNIIQIFDFGKLDDGRLYYTMEYLDGQDLTAFIRENAPLPVHRVQDVLRQMAAALDAAHAVGIVHRDLKPDNVFVCPSPTGEIVKILDFGIAKLLGPGMGAGHRTSTGMIMGTPLYMSPEQAAGDVDKISAKSDIYALSVIVYQMLSGYLPIQAPSTAQILAKHITEQPMPLAQVTAGLPAEVCNLVEQALHKDPGMRPQSAGVMAQKFAAACAGLETGTVARVTRPQALGNAPVDGVATAPASPQAQGGGGMTGPAMGYQSGTQPAAPPTDTQSGVQSGAQPGYGSQPGVPPGYGSQPGVPPGYGSQPGVPPGYGSQPGVPPGYGSQPGVQPGYGSLPGAASMQGSMVQPPKNRAPLYGSLAVVGALVLGVGGFFGYRYATRGTDEQSAGGKKEASESARTTRETAARQGDGADDGAGSGAQANKGEAGRTAPAKLELYTIKVKSEPRKVKVKVAVERQEAFEKVTPFKIEAKRGERIVLKAKREGYENAAQTFVATADRDVSFNLQRKKSTRRRRRRRGRERTRRRATRRPQREVRYGPSTIKPW